MVENFEQFSTWVETTYGLRLTAYKERQMERRLLTLIEKLGLNNFAQYSQLLQTNTQARENFFQYVTINVTDFYRNPEIFEVFEKYLVAYKAKHSTALRIWSAACSIGSEPYTLAMMAAKHQLTNVSITATDLDKAVLATAQAGQYSAVEVRNVPSADLANYFDLIAPNKYQIIPKIQQLVTFKRHDLLGDPYEHNYHFIVCRNVTIYFKPDARDEVYQKFSDALAPNGILFTGATETINFPEKFNLKKIDNFIYQKVN
ncbi:CheR family methyltransferase [Periweissella fabalis]|uniref:protein-glutamate O-methyltransferase n=1 Tax=Periweissella fabalis TaxID=1070421 RepID=A0A7X6N1C0_9LACO|nr:protein-glutamate O-methyltransferase CheR [Periweissella fabalis]MCM0599947.1 protein-glutamate O-methyltransferase CheR [Periweissella fabalis]NKZ23998.1 protein-glutamate O-methyltransferase CheR [Periweissella fabalis]